MAARRSQAEVRCGCEGSFGESTRAFGTRRAIDYRISPTAPSEPERVQTNGSRTRELVADRGTPLPGMGPGMMPGMMGQMPGMPGGVRRLRPADSPAVSTKDTNEKY